MRRTCVLLAMLVCHATLAAPAASNIAREQAAHAEERPGETDDGERVFPPLPVPGRAVTFKDPVVAELAGRIISGHADLRDRRAWYAMSLLYSPFDALPPSGWRADALHAGSAISIETRKRQAALRTAGKTSDAALLATYTWSSLGPTNYSVGGSDLAQGRASSLWVNPNNINVIFAGFAGGGVWKTVDGGSTWTPMSDFEVSTSIGSMDVVAGSDNTSMSDATVFVGLGEGNTASDSIDGGGVLRSNNGGASWTLQTLPWANPDAATSARFRHSIRKIVVDSNGGAALSVWAAGDGGVYHTIDGGSTWSLVTSLPYTGKPGVGGCWPELATDFVVDNTVAPSRLYAAFGARSNGSQYAELTCTGVANDVNYRKNNGIYRSTDNGATWTKITGSGTNFPAVPGQVGRITLLQAPSAKKQMYALISCVGSSCPNGQYSSLGIYRTLDASATTVAWTLGATTNFCSSQGWYDLTGAVDPTTPSKLFVAGLDTYLSTNSGGAISSKSSWTGSGGSFVHADQHQMVYPNTTTVFVACDGGIFKGVVNNTSVTWSNLNAGGLSTLQFYGIGQHPGVASRIHGGLQDNGEAYTASGSSWVETNNGDGGFSATDWSNGDIAYQEYVYGAIYRSTSGGASGWSCIQDFGGCFDCSGCVPDNQTTFIAPIAQDANMPATLYTGSKYVYRNTAAPTGSSWDAVSPDLVGTAYDSILNIHSAPNAGVPGTIWTTTLNGKVWVTTDNAASWTDTTRSPLPNNPVLPNRAATWLTTHPIDGRKAIVVYSGWNGSGSQPGHVFRTLDGGASWADISGALPDEPVFTVAVDPARPNDVYIGTEYGVYVNSGGWTGTTWTKINSGQLPNVHVHQLEFSKANGKLRAATHGRGIWELNVACPSYAPPVLDPPAMNGCGVQLSWTPSGTTGTTYDVYRASGSCPASGFVPIATGVTGTSYLDVAVSGGLTYSYKVTTAESAGACESAPSSCVPTTVSGACPCNVPPTFAGATGVSAPFDATCTLTVNWSAGAQTCGAAAPVYNLYRSTNPAFTPDASNRIATCVSGTSFTDNGVIAPGSTYVYVVRAEDGSGSGGGPCRGGTEEGNTVRQAMSPRGALMPAPFSDGAEGAPLMTMGAPLWSQSSTRAHSGSTSYFANGAPLSTCAALTTPLLALGSAGSPSALSFYSWRDNLENTYDGGVVEISTDDGTSWMKLPLTPSYPTTFASDADSCADTAQAPAARGFTGNDTSWKGPYTADLTPYAGQASRIRFNFGTDSATTSVGWYLDDITVSNTSQPTACTAGAASTTEVSSAGSGVPLLVSAGVGGQLVLSYEDIPGMGGYNVYSGTIGTWYSHAGSGADLCGAASTTPAGGRRQTTVTPVDGDQYFLVTAYTATEGPSGFATDGEIPPADSTCAP